MSINSLSKSLLSQLVKLLFKILSKKEVNCSYVFYDKKTKELSAVKIGVGTNLYFGYTKQFNEIIFSTDEQIIQNLCGKVSELDFSNFDTSLVQDMDAMFMAIGTKHLDLSSFNTSNVVRMYQMFIYADDIITLNISGWDTSNATTMGYMFAGCYNLKSIDVSSFNTSEVKDMSYMFYSMNLNYNMKLKVLDLSSFDTSSVTSMNKM